MSHVNTTHLIFLFLSKTPETPGSLLRLAIIEERVLGYVTEAEAGMWSGPPHYSEFPSNASGKKKKKKFIPDSRKALFAWMFRDRNSITTLWEEIFLVLVVRIVFKKNLKIKNFIPRMCGGD
jgi:hypothetical protein